ncbi:MAG TPA: metallophosphoesterase [Bryobacteraceae bacterium]|nr:metallophosphoesterase [Bryobacteraceae bacterium]
MGRTLPIVVGACLLSASLAAEEAAANVSFLQFADTQFGMFAANRNYDQESANFEFAIAAANRLKPRFVVVCGDLVNQPGDEQQIAEYLRIEGKLDKDILIYRVAGNHDVGNQPTSASLQQYRKKLGPDFYSFREGPVYGIVLNSSLIHSPQFAAAELDEQEQWLRKELAQAKKSGAAHTIVFVHHPFFLKAIDEPDQYFNIPLDRRKRYLDLLRSHGVRYIFAGHYHRNAIASDGDLHMITTGPVGKPLGGDKSGLRVVSISKEHIAHQFYDFGSLPNSLTKQPGNTTNK